MKARLLLRRAALAVAAAALAVEVALRLTPLPAALAAGTISSTEFLDREGRPLRTLLVNERRFARRCELRDVSPHLLSATIAAEDQRFFKHPGVDPFALARAIASAVRKGEPGSGASTITQQLVKLASPGPRPVRRKLAEMWLALRVERAWSKECILAEYLNRLDYGDLQTGIGAASRHYFSKPPSDLSAAEAAFLAGLPRAPSRLNPHAHLDAARARQQWVLARMVATGGLDADAHARAVAEPLRLASPGREWAAPQFVDLLLSRRGLVPPEGGPVRTTLDLPLTRFVERSLRDQIRKIADKHATSAAAVVIDNATGDVLALAGSDDDFQPGTGGVNGAWSVRSPGSAVKPFTYLLALERGANPCSVVADVPTDWPTPDGLYRPNNYNHRFYGPVSLRFALGNSLNIGAIRVLELAGGPEALAQRLRALGISTLDHPADFYGLGLTLGNGEVRLLELASAFTTIGRLGIHRPYRLLAHEPAAAREGRHSCDARATFLVADMLADNTARAASFGTDSFLAFDFPVACKTGTSSDYRDNWALGCTPEWTVGVWVGNADNSPMRGITGVTGAAPVMHEVMTHLRATRGTSDFPRPAGILEASVHPLTGHRVPADRPGAVTEKCLWLPPDEIAADYDATGRVALGSQYAPWLASPQNTLGELVSCANAATPLHIAQPAPGAIYFLDPDLPAETQWIALRAEGAGAVTWSCTSLPCKADDARPRVQLREGRHCITVRDASGSAAETWIEVRAL